MKLRTLAFGFLLTVPLAALSQTTIFDDTFSDGSTINSTNETPPTATATSYEEIASKGWSPNPPTNGVGNITWGIVGTPGGGGEVQALFTTTPVVLQTAGQYIQLTVTFTANEGFVTNQLGMGLFNANQVAPLAGGVSGSGTFEDDSNADFGGAEGWVGTISQFASTNGTIKSDFADRPAQGITASNNCDQVTEVNGSVDYGYANSTTHNASATNNVNFLAGNQYTEVLTYTLQSDGGLGMTASFYLGASSSGTPLASMTYTNTAPLATTFDAFSMGFRDEYGVAPTIVALNSVQIVTTAPYSPGCISQLFSSSSLVVGQTNGSVAVTIPPGATASGPLSVDLSSSDPAVAYPGGAPSGTLTLTFPQNTGYNTTNVSVVAAENGAAIFYLTNATDDTCISDGAGSNLVTVACDPITLSPNGSVVSLVGQTDQLVTVTISPYANLTGPVTVDLVSLNPSVVTPAGAVDGTLELTFAANGATSQSVNLNTLAQGTATLVLNNNSGPVCTSIATNQTITITVPQPQGTNMTSEDFSSEEEAAADGWVGYLNTSNGEAYGWSDTDNAGGSNPGEAGGSFVRDTNLNYYADITVGPLTLNDYIYASGTLIIDPPSDNAAFDICYFNTNNANGSSDNILGIGIADNGSGNPTSRISVALGDATAGGNLNSEVFGPSLLEPGIPVPWTFNYDPTAGAGYGQLTLNYNENGTECITNINLTAAQRDAGANFNAFGMMVRGIAPLDTTDIMGIYMGDVTYTRGYSLIPASIPLQISAVGSAVTVTWTNAAFSLESSTNVAGPYQVIQGATSPYQTSSSNSASFYRLIAQ